MRTDDLHPRFCRIVVDQFHFHEQAVRQSGNREDGSIPERVLWVFLPVFWPRFLTFRERVPTQNELTQEFLDAFGSEPRQVRIITDEMGSGILPLQVPSPAGTKRLMDQFESRGVCNLDPPKSVQ